METKNTTIGYLVGKETFSPGEGDNPNFFNFPQKFFPIGKRHLMPLKKRNRMTTIMIPRGVIKEPIFAQL